MKINNRGFTLIEMLVVIALVAILAGISTPAYLNWMENARFREAARNVSSMLRDARARAVTTNLQHRVAFDLDGQRYDLERQDAPASATWETALWGATTVPAISLRSGANCENTTGDTLIIFNPNGSSAMGGSAGSLWVCISERDGTRRFRVGVTSTTTGRVAIQRWNGAAWQ